MDALTYKCAARLAVGIIAQAVSDYKELVNGIIPYELRPNSALRKDAEYMEAQRQRHLRELDKFFHSGWFDTLLMASGITADRVLKYLAEYKEMHWKPMQLEHDRRPQSKCRAVRCIETGEVFKDREELAQKIGKQSKTILAHIKSGKPIHGYHYEEVSYGKARKYDQIL